MLHTKIIQIECTLSQIKINVKENSIRQKTGKRKKEQRKLKNTVKENP